MTSADRAYETALLQTLNQFGLSKHAFAPALLAAGRAALPGLARAGTSAMRGMRVGGSHAMNALRQGGQAFAQQAPGVAKGLQTAGKVLSNPMTQMGLMAAPLAMKNS